jgi:hypothetical protein
MVATRNQRQHLPILQLNGWAMLYGAATTARGAPLGERFSFDRSWRYVTRGVLAVFGSIAFGAPHADEADRSTRRFIRWSQPGVALDLNVAGGSALDGKSLIGVAPCCWCVGIGRPGAARPTCTKVGERQCKLLPLAQT